MAKPLALIVEDDPQLSQIFTIALDELFTTEAIADGTEAMTRLSKVVPFLIVLDINLPGVSGTQILKAIRSNSRFKSTRVIIATASPRQAEEVQDDADIVLVKPVSPAQLRQLASRIMR